LKEIKFFKLLDERAQKFVRAFSTVIGRWEKQYDDGVEEGAV
jgi:hypothetical protein